jgi:CheY-like chemotaxis protein
MQTEQANKQKSPKELRIGLANVNHEIKTPLNAIIGFTDLLLGDETGANQRKRLRTINQACHRLLNIINDMSDYSLIEGDAMVSRWLDTGKDVFERKDYIQSYLPKLPDALERLRDAIRRNQPQTIEFLAHEIKGVTGNLGMTELYDPAAGINREIAEKNYDIDKIKKQFICLQQVMASIPNAYFDKAHPVPALINDEHERTENGTILVAEDNPVNQLFLKGLLRKINFKADIAGNGKEVLEMLSQNRYALLLLDIQMPVMDGLATIAHIRAQTDLKKFPVIALTADTSPNDVAKYLKAGCNDCLSKPIKPDKLEAKIRAMITPNTKRPEGNALTAAFDDIPAPAFLEIVSSAVAELKPNTRIFDPHKVREQAEALSELAEIPMIAPILEQLNYSATTFDDEVLASAIEQLEALL